MAASAAAASRGALMRAGLTRRPVRRCSAAASPVPREAVKDILNHLIAGEDAAALKARRQALISAGTGKALEGRDLAAVELLDSSLWLPEVQQCWSRHHDVARLSGAALRLRVTPMGASSSSSGGVAAAPAPEARDWQVLGRVVPVRLLLSPWAAVLQSYASSAVLESRSTAGIHPAVHGAMMNQAKHWQEHLGQPGPEGPLEDPSGEYAAAEFREWATQSAEAAKEHVRLTSHFFAEVAQHTLGGARGHHFLSAAAELVGADPALDAAAVEYAAQVFQ
ncbi:unnamed protein product, partial [Prorocentrum cordatum]